MHIVSKAELARHKATLDLIAEINAHGRESATRVLRQYQSAAGYIPQDEIGHDAVLCLQNDLTPYIKIRLSYVDSETVYEPVRRKGDFYLNSYQDCFTGAWFFTGDY